MVFPTCESISSSTGIGSNCKINIAYNKQKPLCASTSSTMSQKKCRMPDQLCSADPDFKFDFTPGSPVRPIHLKSFIPCLIDIHSGSPALMSRHCHQMGPVHYYFSTHRFRLHCLFRFILGILISMVFLTWCQLWYIKMV